MDWEDRLDDWQNELELQAHLDDSEWVPLDRACTATGVSRPTLRNWYRTGQIPSRLVDGPHGPQRLVPLSNVSERASASARIRNSVQQRLDDAGQLAILRARVDALELRLARLEQPHDQR